MLAVETLLNSLSLSAKDKWDEENEGYERRVGLRIFHSSFFLVWKVGFEFVSYWFKCHRFD